ncbi:Uma2 family endonuclease [Synechococcales cyanobacterium C]|uniref:Uma2 family endonuclease n=1 Tax=Petrachloros mirabilis ULC683 TaxID=2781853 RepID=A0A8K1ZWI6_9CYAN|nr:Uma2 family endonuclease [Petrachloros mirabilis]NCJ06540.1 Uma2 family endonuclease [Petrachloros mirabilis ULC683]
MTTLRIQAKSVPLAIHVPAMVQTSEAEFYEFCQANQNLRIERTATGDVIIVPPTSSETGNRNSKICQQLSNWADRDGTGEVFDSSTGFTLPNGAIRSPDASWIRRDRWDGLTAPEQASFAPICPDFVIELRSASDALPDLQAKMQEYIGNGASLGWLIDRIHQTVHIYRPHQMPQVLNHPDMISADPDLPGFTLPLAKIW